MAAYQRQEKENRDKLQAELNAQKLEADRLRVQQEAAAKNPPRPVGTTVTVKGGTFEGLSDFAVLKGMVTDLRGMSMPSMKTVKGSEIAANVRHGFAQLADYIELESRNIPS